MVSGDAYGFVGKHIEPQVRVDARVGEGGFSVVYRGRHIGLNEDVAIKCMKLPAALPPAIAAQLVERFRAESQISYRLSQGSLDIVRSISSGGATAASGHLVPYIVLEWLSGKSLAEDFTSRRRTQSAGRPLAEVLALFEPAARALEHAHRQGVVHRDVKPGNLFLAVTRSGVRLKVLDFGMAKVLEPAALGVNAAETLTRVTVCSPAYGAPEQFDTKRYGAVDPSTDVYGLAMVILEALSGKKVRQADTMIEGLRLAIDPAARPSARALGLSLPPRLEALLDRCVHPDKASRPRDAGELWAEIQSAMVAGPTAPANPPPGAMPVATVKMYGSPGTSPAATTLGPGGALSPGAFKAAVPVGMALRGTVIMHDRPAPAVEPPTLVATLTAPESTDAPPGTDPMPFATPKPAYAQAPSASDTLDDPTRIAPPRPPAAPLTAPPPPFPAPSPRPPVETWAPVSKSRVALVGAIAFFGTLLVLMVLGFGAYRLWLARHGAG